MARHTQVERFQSKIQQERVLRRLLRTEVAHQMGAAFDDIRRLAELFGIDDAVIGLVGRGEHREIALCPIKVAGIDDTAAKGNRVTVHVLRGGMDDDICAPFEGTAIDRGRKGIIDDQRDIMRVSDICKKLDINNIQRGIGDGLDKDRFGIGLELLIEILGGDRRADEIEIDAEVAERFIKEIERTAVDRRGRDDMIARFGDIGDADQGCCLTRRGQHRADAALKRRDLLFDRVKSRVAEAGIEKAVLF